MADVRDHYERPETVAAYRGGGLSAAETALIDRYLPAGAVLDVGTGTGRVALALARRGLTVTGIDISEAMIAAAKENAVGLGLQAEFVVGDAAALPFSTGAFAASLYLCNGIGHLDRDTMARCLRELRRVTRTDGVVLLSFRTPYAVNRLLPGLLVRSVMRRGPARDETTADGVYVNRPSPRTMRRLVRAAGLELVEETTLRATGRSAGRLDRFVGGQFFIAARSI